MYRIKKFLDEFSRWTEEEDNILAVGLVGSYARDAAKEDSDVDLMIIVKDPEIYLSDNNWIQNFGETKEIKNETWGQVKTRRVFYRNGLEVEFNFDKKSWANPEDSGTKRVVTDGMRVLVDKEKILETLKSAFTN